MRSFKLGALLALLGAGIASAANITVVPTDSHQKIAGFGGGIANWYFLQSIAKERSGDSLKAIMDSMFLGAGTSMIRVAMPSAMSAANNGVWNDTTPTWTDKYPYKCWNQPAGTAPACTAYSVRSLWGATKIIVNEGKARLGVRPKIFMSLWSPPPRFKASGSSQGSAAGGDMTKNTLAKDKNGKFVYGDVAHWMAIQVKMFKDTLGFYPDYLSLQNEPWTLPSYGACNYAPVEGNTTSSKPMDIAGYREMFQALYDTLAKKLPGAEKTLVGPELEGTMNGTTWMKPVDWRDKESGTASYLRRLTRPAAAYAFHLYHNNYTKPSNYWYEIDSIAQMDNQGTTVGNHGFPRKPLIVSENMWLAHDNDSVKYAKAKLVGLAHTLAIVMGREDVAGYLNWQLAWPKGQMIDPGTPSARALKVNAEYWTMRHLSHFVRPGWVRIGSASDDDSAKFVAFRSEAGDSVVLFGTNLTKAAKTLALPAIAGYSLKRWVQSTGSAYFVTKTLPTGTTVSVADSSVQTFVWVRNANQAPVITMTKTSANLDAPGTISWSWSASDADGSVKLVELLQNGTGIKYLPQAAGLKSATGTFVVAGLPVGNHVFTPKVTDELGKITYGANFNATVTWNYALTTSGATNWYGGLYIGYKLPAATAGSARILSATGAVVKTIDLAAGSSASRFTSVSGQPSGTYTVQLLVNGTVVAGKTVVKL